MNQYNCKTLVSILSGLTFLVSAPAFAFGPRIFAGDACFLAKDNGAVWKVKNDGEAIKSDISPYSFSLAAHGNGFWLMENANSIYKSADGIHWKVLEIKAPSGFNVTNLFYSKGQFYAISAHGLESSICTSADGVNWKCVKTSFSSYTRNSMEGIKYCGGVMYRVGETRDSSPSGMKYETLFLTSVNGNSFQKHTLNLVENSSSCAGNKIIFHGSIGNYYSYSVRKGTLLEHNLPAHQEVSSAAGSNGNVVLDILNVVGNSYVLTNGAKTTLPLLSKLNADNGAFLGLTQSSFGAKKMYISKNGVNWIMVR